VSAIAIAPVIPGCGVFEPHLPLGFPDDERGDVGRLGEG
jgi:hypothetical protein